MPTFNLSRVNDQPQTFNPRLAAGFSCLKCPPGLLSRTSTNLKVTFDARVNVLQNCSYGGCGILSANSLESQGSFIHSLPNLSFQRPCSALCLGVL